MASSDRRSDKRRFPRRAKSVRFRFEHAGDQHYAVSTFVSLAGAYLKASHVPRPGTLLSLCERFNTEGAEVLVRAEVMWSQDEATLERPETGFGVRFIEIATRGDPGHIEDFLKALDPTRSVTEIEFEERSNGAHAVYRFPITELDPDAYREEEASFADFDEPVVIDLERELGRLGREDARARAAEAPVSDLIPPPLPPPDLPEAPPLPDSGQRQRSHKRSVTGIFTALFTRARVDDLGVDQGSEPTPAIGEATLIHDSRRPKILLSWQGGSVVARIESLGRQSATLWTNDAAPERGQEVMLKPVGTGPTFDLAIRAKVLTRDDRARSGVSWLSLAFVKVDENGRVGRFQEYLRHINGPGADER